MEDLTDTTSRSASSKEGSKPSPAATSFCLALACCACGRVPASLFCRPCQPRREWHSSGDVVDSRTHLEELPSRLFTLFDTTPHDQELGTQQATKGDTISVPKSQQHAFHDHRLSQAAPLSTPRRDSAGRSAARKKGSRLSTHREPQENTRIHLEIVGLLLSGLEIGRKEEAKMPFSIYRCLGIDYLEKHLIVV